MEKSEKLHGKVKPALLQVNDELKLDTAKGKVNARVVGVELKGYHYEYKLLVYINDSKMFGYTMTLGQSLLVKMFDPRLA